MFTVVAQQETKSQAALISELRDKNSPEYVRIAAAGALGNPNLSPEATEDSIRALTEAFGDRYESVRRQAIKSLARIGQPAIPHMIQVFQNDEYQVRNCAAGVLVEIGQPAVPPLIEAVRVQRSTALMYAIFTLNRIGPLSEEAIPPIVAVLNDESADAEPRFWAAVALSDNGYKSDKLVPVLLRLFYSDKERLITATRILGKIKNLPEEVIQHFAVALERGDREVREVVAGALRQIGEPAKGAEPALLAVLKEEELFYQATAEQSRDTVLKDEQDRELRRSIRVQRAIATALIAIKSEPRHSIPTLMRLFKQKEVYSGSNIRVYNELNGLAEDFKGAGPTPVPELITIFNEDPKKRTMVLQTLGNIGPEAKEAIPLLKDALDKAKLEVFAATSERYESEGMLRITVNTLGAVGAAEPHQTIPPLIDILNSRKLDMHDAAADALLQIARDLDVANATNSISDLELAHDHLSQSDDSHVKKVAEDVQRTITHLKDRRWKNVFANTKKYWPYVLPVALLLVWLFLLWVKPLWLFHINETLSKWSDFRLPNWLGGMTIPVRYGLLVGFFHYHGRVLDAWVARHVNTARRGFAEKTTVEERSTHVPVPITLDKRNVASLTAKQLRETFSRTMACLLIHGEGGSGKTSLACLFGKWAMAQEKDKRLCEHLMLPVLIEQDADFREKAADAETLLKTVQDHLRLLTGAITHPPISLIKQLLARRRVVVIIDGLSEMSETARKNILAEIAGVPANALIITSRAPDPLNDLPKSIVKPMRVKGTHLSNFLGAYLSHCEKRDLFEDDEFFESCRQLSLISGEREITVLLAKLFADQMIASKDGSTDDDLPKNIPDLMLNYLNTINRETSTTGLDDESVHLAAEIVAWQCLKDAFYPMPAGRADAVAVFEKEGLGSNAIKYMDEKLKIIQIIGAARDRIRFILDPLAEYLAGLYIINRCGNREEDWMTFLDQFEKHESYPTKSKGFLLALYDCLVVRSRQGGIPQSVLDRILELLPGPQGA